ncbi:uncharacterized protein LOC129907060 [Episyrphus balteatus]|uniref:uncharacterized protein LOC129907060 n=1 Tax=Episyrphus balteatus TaxID=286459 RepID=UPI002486BCF0|nr:uncharacterized protein LOC129907060 [Episyrphus balteatus]
MSDAPIPKSIIRPTRFPTMDSNQPNETPPTNSLPPLQNTQQSLPSGSQADSLDLMGMEKVRLDDELEGMDLTLSQAGSDVLPTEEEENHLIRQEVLDITFGTSNLGQLVEGWRVSNEPSLSDHRIITFSITRLFTENTSGRNPKKTDWNLYKSVVQINLERIGPARTTKSHLELDHMVNEFSGAINEAFELSCPIKPIKSQRDAPWWSKNLSKQRSKVRKLFNEAKRTGEWEGYTAELTIYNKEIRKAKRNSFVSFCENITATPAAARLHKALAKDKTIKSLALRYNDGSFTENEEQRSTLLLNTHFPGSLPMTGNVIESTTFKPNKTDWKLATAICSGKRIDWAINTFQLFKSPGVDGIFPALLQKGAEDLMPYIISILRSSMALAHVPSLWRRA